MTARFAVVSPYVANLLLKQLPRSGWDSQRRRHAAMMLRSGGYPDLADQLEESFDQLKASAAEFLLDLSTTGAAPVASVDGSDETEMAAVGASSGHDEVTTQQAARVLGVSARRITQLVADGSLVGRKVGRSWLVDGGSVMSLDETRRSA